MRQCKEKSQGAWVPGDSRWRCSGWLDFEGSRADSEYLMACWRDKTSHNGIVDALAPESEYGCVRINYLIAEAEARNFHITFIRLQMRHAMTPAKAFDWIGLH